MKKMIICLMIMLTLLIPYNVSATPLIQIEIGDTWIYEVENPLLSYSLEQEVTNVTFEVIGIDYITYGGEDMRVNKISSNVIIDDLRIRDFSMTYPIRETAPCGGNANIALDFGDVINDVIYRSARGNFLYKRVTELYLDVNISSIIYNNTAYDDYITTTIITVVELSNNPSIIETVATGVIQRNLKTLTIGEFDVSGFLGFELSEIGLYFQIDERYEASNEFTYQNTTCRNITITPLDYTVTNMYINGLTNFTAWFGEPDVPISVDTYQEDWIYSYDAGLPLEIVKTPITTEPVMLIKLAVEEPQPIYKMTLIDLDLLNSDYEFPKEPTTTTPITTEPTETTNVSIWMLPLMMATYIMFYIKKKRP